MTEHVLEVRGVNAGYGDITAIRDVTFAVAPGRITAILGRNGAGKTTTLRAVSGLVAPTAGTVIFDGADVTGLPAYDLIGLGVAFVQEGKRVFRSLSVEDNLVLGAYANQAGRRGAAAVVAAAYERFPALHDKRHEPASVLSGGQQQMLAIAQALGSDPQLLLLDEPSIGLSPALVAQVLEIVTGLRDEGIAVLLVEQSVDVALRIADDVAVIDLGRVVLRADRDTPELHRAVEDAYFGRLAEELVA